MVELVRVLGLDPGEPNVPSLPTWPETKPTKLSATHVPSPEPAKSLLVPIPALGAVALSNLMYVDAFRYQS